MKLIAATLALAASFMLAPAANACSVSWAEGWSPEEIKERADVRRVRGVFKLLELAGERHVNEDGQEWVFDGRFIGRIETRRGTAWNTVHNAPDHSTTCYVAMYFKPEKDAEGTFWITRTKTDGRYQILLWEGQYLSGDSEKSDEE